jgi:phosphoribosylformylglycinamidine cyclo-ligase
MPGFYADGEYDIAGFIVGIVDRARLIDGRSICPGDVLIALPSAGLHTNGYSLARRVLFEEGGYTPDTFVPELDGTIGEALLAPHRSYLRQVTPLLDGGYVKGIAHVTGGGMTENLPRILPDGCAALVDRHSWNVPSLFTLLQHRGAIAREEMFRAFNMGVGLILVCREAHVAAALAALAATGESSAWRLGTVVSGDRDVRYLG